tara:strand:- start:85 stop:318 length:234 start_codon:yes stop_codon:yes gene_type:complete
MTYPAPDQIQYDPWFDPEYKYNPLDSMPIATDEPLDLAPSSVEPQDDDETLHEKMYQMAVQKHSPWKGGGSENFLHK